RFSRDWSSDVCSSDLKNHAGGVEAVVGRAAANLVPPIGEFSSKTDAELERGFQPNGIFHIERTFRGTPSQRRVQRRVGVRAYDEIGRASCRERVDGSG